MKYKMIVSDFDGTLLGDNHEIPQNNIDAIKKYTERGGKFVIATGRIFSAIIPHIQNLGLQGKIITCQGAVIYDIQTEEIFSYTPLEQAKVLNVIKYLNGLEDKVTICMFYENKIFVDKNNEFSLYFGDVLGVTVYETNLPLDEHIKQNNIVPTKLVVLINPKKSTTVSEYCKGAFEGMSFHLSTPFIMEVVNNKASKGKAIESLCNLYNITPDEVIAIGDANNDAPMINFAGLGVAVGNAMQTLKDIADEVTVTNNEGAVATIINEYMYLD
ncbi:MAG: Cof-type HAD-IIB family hydrolase [Clostridia bacterium]